MRQGSQSQQGHVMNGPPMRATGLDPAGTLGCVLRNTQHNCPSQLSACIPPWLRVAPQGIILTQHFQPSLPPSRTIPSGVRKTQGKAVVWCGAARQGCSELWVGHGHPGQGIRASPHFLSVCGGKSSLPGTAFQVGQPHDAGNAGKLGFQVTTNSFLV